MGRMSSHTRRVGAIVLYVEHPKDGITVVQKLVRAKIKVASRRLLPGVQIVDMATNWWTNHEFMEILFVSKFCTCKHLKIEISLVKF